MIGAIRSSGRSVISVFGHVELELAVDAEAADAAQAVAVGVVELFVEQRPGLFQLRRIARTQPLIDPQQRFFVAGVVSSARLLKISGVFGVVHHLDLRRRPEVQIASADVLGDLLAALDDDLAGPVAADRIDDVVDGDLAFDLADAAAVDDLLASWFRRTRG